MFDENCFFSRGAPAVRQTAGAARASPATIGQGGTPAGATTAPGGQGGSGHAPQPPDTFFESTYPEMQRKHIPRVNEYQS